LNLAGRPFRNERLPRLLFSLGLLALGAASVEHAIVLRRLLPDRTSALHAEAAALEGEVAALRADGSALRGPGPDRLTLERWSTLKELVDRRTFAWTELMARLESVLPRGVRLVAIQPKWERGELKLELEALARSADEGFGLVKALEDRPEFEEVYPLSKDERQDGSEVRFRYAMRYKPSAVPFPVAGAQAPADAAGAGDQGAP
jgi:hypothetical protein